MGYFDDEGYRDIVDWKKNMIGGGGFNVFPREMENTIGTFPGMREVAVVGTPSERWGEVVTVSLMPGFIVMPGDVTTHCRTKVEGYNVSKQVFVVDDLSKGGTGKIMKSAIRAQLPEGRPR